MKRFTDLIIGGLIKVGGKFSNITAKAKEISSNVKALVRTSHLFARAKEQKRKVDRKLYHTVMELQELIEISLSQGERRLHGKASIEIDRLSNLMDTLLPQILFF